MSSLRRHRCSSSTSSSPSSRSTAVTGPPTALLPPPASLGDLVAGVLPILRLVVMGLRRRGPRRSAPDAIRLLGRRHLHCYLGFLRPALAYQRLDLRGSHGDRGPLGLHPPLLFHHCLPAMLEQQDGMDLTGRKESFLRSASKVSHVESVVSDNDEKRRLGYQFQVPVVETVTPHLAEEAAGGGIWFPATRSSFCGHVAALRVAARSGLQGEDGVAAQGRRPVRGDGGSESGRPR